MIEMLLVVLTVATGFLGLLLVAWVIEKTNPPRPAETDRARSYRRGPDAFPTHPFG
jgi:hypothetical protein